MNKMKKKVQPDIGIGPKMLMNLFNQYDNTNTAVRLLGSQRVPASQ